MIKLKQLLLENDSSYKGNHSSPDKHSGAPLYDLTKIYPDDIYSHNASRFYGDGVPEYSDNVSLSIMNAVKNKPNAHVKIYRAVPNFNVTIEKQIKKLSSVVSYVEQFGFPPIKDREYSDIFSKLGYNKQKFLDKLTTDIKDLTLKKISSLKINDGDWVTINKQYAIMHGNTNLLGTYKILTKTVSAKQLFTTADNLHEFGYDPS